MNSNRESLLLAGAEFAAVLFCLASVVWDFVSGLIFNIDGLLLLVISLTLAAVFAFVFLLQARSAGWLAKLPVLGGKKSGATDAK